jgi:serine/threonine-protein kinase HipA
MASEYFVHRQLPGTAEVVPCGRFVTTGDGRTPGVGRYVYGRSYRARLDAVAVDPYNLPIVTTPA